MRRAIAAAGGIEGDPGARQRPGDQCRHRGREQAVPDEAGDNQEGDRRDDRDRPARPLLHAGLSTNRRADERVDATNRSVDIFQ